MRTLRYAAVVLTVAYSVGVAGAMWMRPQYLPVERLIANATAYVAEEPNDPAGYYTLARIHYLAFANKAFLVGAFNEQTPPSVIEYWWWEDYLGAARYAEAMRVALDEYGVDSAADLPAGQVDAFWSRVSQIQTDLEREGWRPERPTTDQLIEHAGAAQWNFYRAAALDPNNALYVLGQASLGEQYLEFFAEAGGAPMPAGLKTILLNAVRQTYLLAYDLSIRADLMLDRLPITGLRGIISYEAGSAFVRLWHREKEVPKDVQDRLAAIQANLAKFEALPIGAITPIVFGLEGGSSLADLLAPATVVSFDLDGDGRAEKRPWVKSTTGFLVWDCGRTGRVTSGRQMFGSATWWMLFKNGYRAMDALDDNRNGRLDLGEMEGLSVWFDRNSDGLSDSGEVIPVCRLGISAIATRPDGLDGISPMCAAGLTLEDGRVLPTYDWIAPPATPTAAR
ncbi:MAG TPA: hypothetical protein PLU87_18245 [Sedimentisphaerales bacterium]|nr:hypothetical protein [Sedimentisphaerales bacterium]HRS13003.1 hypothetical protein [Sedimentisphaerales bacterium]HRV49575.1 hypothetical protein [Sedimentisphaerales bacterium]